MRFSFVDVETTGLDPRSAAMVELAIVQTDDSGRVLDRYETMLNPLVKLQATRIHGIKSTHVLAAPTFELVAADVAERLDGTFVVAYNAPFDSTFLRHAMASIGGRIEGPWVCALEEVQRRVRAPRYRLLDVATALGLQPPAKAHSALADAELCAAAFFAAGGCDRPLRPVRAAAPTPYRVPPMPRSVAEEHGTARRPIAPERSLQRTGADVAPVVRSLHDAFADGKVTPAEVRGLAEACERSGFSTGDLLAAFNQFLEEELEAILADGEVHLDERQRLRVISHHLGFPAPYIERRLIGEVPPGTLGGELQPALTVVFTNVDDELEWQLGRTTTMHGLCVRHGVAKTTDLVVFDGERTTTKAKRAAELGIPLMPLAEFERCLPGGHQAVVEPTPTVVPNLVRGADLDDVEVIAGDEAGTASESVRVTANGGPAPTPTAGEAARQSIGSVLRRLLRRRS